MDYFYDVPVIVRKFGDESEDVLTLNNRVLEMVRDTLAGEVNVFRDGYLSRRLLNLYVSTIVQKTKTGISLQVSLSQPEYSEDVDHELMSYVMMWMRYGPFDNGLNVMGQYHGYRHENVVVYTWDKDLKITARTKHTEQA